MCLTGTFLEFLLLGVLQIFCINALVSVINFRNFSTIITYIFLLLCSLFFSFWYFNYICFTFLNFPIVLKCSILFVLSLSLHFGFKDPTDVSSWFLILSLTESHST